MHPGLTRSRLFCHYRNFPHRAICRRLSGHVGGKRCIEEGSVLGKGFAAVDHVVKNCEQRKVFTLADGIEFVVVAFGASEGQPQPGGARCVDPVDDAFDAVFFDWISVALGLGRVPVERRGNRLFGSSPGQQVAGQLLKGELVERHVLGDGFDHPVPIGPDGARLVVGKTVGVGVPCQIEPVLGLALRIGVGRHEFIDRP